jgi:nitroreductase
MGSVYETIRQRRSIRRFTNQRLPEDVLLKLVDAARLAPSGANIQPCEYVVVDESTLVDAIFPCLKWAAYIAPAGDPSEEERPVAYIAVLIDLHRKKKDGGIDAAAGIENVLLAAWEEGIGSCWIRSIHRKKIKKLLRIPHHLEVNSIIALGYSNEEPVVEEMKDSIKYWKDEKGVLHVPKRKLEDIVHKNGYGR